MNDIDKLYRVGMLFFWQDDDYIIRSLSTLVMSTSSFCLGIVKGNTLDKNGR